MVQSSDPFFPISKTPLNCPPWLVARLLNGEGCAILEPSEQAQRCHQGQGCQFPSNQWVPEHCTTAPGLQGLGPGTQDPSPAPAGQRGLWGHSGGAWPWGRLGLLFPAGKMRCEADVQGVGSDLRPGAWRSLVTHESCTHPGGPGPCGP